MSGNDQLVEAAARLRDLAARDAVPPGPWQVTDRFGEWEVVADDPDAPGFPWDVATCGDKRNDEATLSRLVATMHPGVALALADWLDAEAATSGPRGLDPHTGRAARAVADAVLAGGEQWQS